MFAPTHAFAATLLIALPLDAAAQAVARPAAPKATGAVPAGEQAPLDVEADRLDFDRKAGRARFEGHVRARQADFALSCERLQATYSTEGELVELTVDGGLTLTVGSLTARADRARLVAATGEIVLEGTPELQRGADRLTGALIRLWPKSGRVVVERARGNVLLPRLRAEALGLPSPSTAAPPVGSDAPR